MVNKILIISIIFALVSSSAYAQWIQSLDCDGLLEDSKFLPRNDFNESESICFYGSGFEGEYATLLLKSDDSAYEEQTIINNGIISSIAGGIKKFFSNVAAGIYRLSVSYSGKNVEQHTDIILAGKDDGDNDSYEPEVPEFTTLAAVALLAGIGIYIKKRRV